MTSKRVPKKNQRQAVAVPADKPAMLSEFSRHVMMIAVMLCALVAIAYGNSRGNGFVWDDHEQIVMNPYLKPDAPVAPLFTADVRFSRQDQAESTQVYRPLQMLTYKLVLDWSDGTPEAFHLCSIVFAALGALAACAVFWRLTRCLGMAFAAAALFAVHPAHTEAVDWIAALPDLGFGLFVLLAFALFLRRRDGSQQRLTQGMSLLAFMIALLWKETAVVFPLIVASYVWIVETGVGSRARRALVESSGYWIVLAVYLAVRAGVLQTLTAGPRDWGLTPVQSLLTALHLMVSYWAKLALPVGLNAYYVFHPVRSMTDVRGSFATLLVLAAIAGWIALARRAPLAGFAALWVFIFLLPAMNFSGLGRNPFAERYLYLPSAGFCLLVTISAARLMRRLPAGFRMPTKVALLIAVLVGYTAQTIVRNADWKDDQTLWAETLKQSPDAPFVRIMVASAQSADSTASPLAEQNYRRAIELSRQQIPPDRLYALKGYEGLASLYADRGQVDKAMEEIAQARAIAPDDSDVAAEEGMILARVGQGTASEAALNRALASHPLNENLLAALGVIARDEHHDLKRAVELFSRALAVHPQLDDFNASQHNNLAGVYADQDNYAAAIAELRLAIKTLPNDPEFHVNLASALAATGHFDQARAEAESALRIAPNDPNAAEVLERLNRIK